MIDFGIENSVWLMSLLLSLLHLMLLNPPLWVLGRRRNSVLCLCVLVKSLPCRSSVLGGVAGCLCGSFEIALRPLVIQQQPQLLAPLPLSPHAAGLPKMPLCRPLPGVVLQGCSLCLRCDGHGFWSFQVMLLVTMIDWSLKCAVGRVQAASCKDPLSDRPR